MENYININTLVESEISKLLKDSIICPLCKNIFINPVFCTKCQKVYCKKCIDNLDKKSKKCHNSNFQKCLIKKDILSKLKFKCQVCEDEIDYYDVVKHYKTCKSKRKDSSKTKKASSNKNNNKLTILSSKEVSKLRKQGKEIIYINSKKLNFLYILYFI